MSNTPLNIFMGLGFLGVVGLAVYGICSFNKVPARTIEQVLRADSKLIVLSADEGSISDKEKWDQKVQMLESGNENPKLNGYRKEVSGEATTKKARNIKAIKGVCRWLLSSDAREYFKFVQAKYWCTVSAVKQKDS